MKERRRDRVAPASREALHEEIVTADVPLRLTFLFSFRWMQNEYEIFTRYGE